jgi:hypothetical protein
LAFIESRNVRVVVVVVVVVVGGGCFIVDRGFGTSALLRRFWRGMPFGCGQFCFLKLIVFCESIESGNSFVAFGWMSIFGPLHNDSRMVSRSERAGRRRTDLLSTKSDRCTRYSIIDRFRYTELRAIASNYCRSAPPRRG